MQHHLRGKFLLRSSYALALALFGALACGDDPPTGTGGAGEVATLAVTPGSLAFNALGDSAQLAAALRDENGNEVAGAAVQWASLDPTVATVSPSGWVRALDNGTAGVVASAEGAADTVKVTVVQVAATVELTPGVDTLLAQDETVQLAVVVTDSNGVAIEAPAVEWSSTAPAVAAVDADGLVTALRGGRVVLSATMDGVSDQANFTVLDRLVFERDLDGDVDIWVVDADGSRESLLTFDGGNMHPVWSPDGTKIAFTSDRDGNGEVYVMNADGSDQTNLSRSRGFDTRPVWSPDGGRILFISDRDGNDEIYVMNADGSSPTNLSRNAARDWEAAWSPDGTTIAFVSLRDNENYDIWVMDADGSDPRQFTTDGDFIHTDPRWSPDGTRIAFLKGPGSYYNIHVMNANGTGTTPLTRDNDIDPVWSPDGERIAFVSSRTGALLLYTMNADGTEEQVFRQGSSRQLGPAWSPDGTSIAFTYSPPTGSSALRVYYPTQALPLVNLTRYRPGVSDRSPAWRPRPRP